MAVSALIIASRIVVISCKRHIAFIKLAIADDRIDDLNDDGADVFRIGTRQRTRRRLTRISQHHDGRFLELRLWTRITKIFFLDHFTRFGLLCALRRK